MSTEEVTVPEIEVPASAGGAITVEDALREVIRRSHFHDGLVCGLRQTVKALESKAARMCILSEGCEEKEYIRLVEALCHEMQIQLIKVADGKKLGEWVGLCKMDKNGDARKVVGCSSVAICDFGEESQYLEVLMDQVKA